MWLLVLPLYFFLDGDSSLYQNKKHPVASKTCYNLHEGDYLLQALIHIPFFKTTHVQINAFKH